MKSFVERKTCRACGSSNLVFLFSLGEQYVNNFVPLAEVWNGPKAPIELRLCNDCKLVQNPYTAPPEILYSRFYWYRSGVTETMRNALRDITASAEALVPLRPGDVVLDIGSNDGTLLRTYTKPGIVRVGVEPADNLVEEGSHGIEKLIHGFWKIQDYIEQVGTTAKVITAIGMFYDLDDPNQFIGDIAKALHTEGVFIAQLMCLRDMLFSNDIGNLAHEHLEYYSLESLQNLFSTHGLQIIDVEHNQVNGGSYRFYITRKGSWVRSHSRAGARERIKSVMDWDQGLTDLGAFKEFAARVERNKRITVDFIRDAVKLGKIVWVYGASTKGNVILQYYGLNASLIEGAAERSPEKWGKYTVGTGIKIHSEEEARQAKPDYFLVLPYAFIDEFVKREWQWVRDGGRFLVPLPDFRIV